MREKFLLLPQASQSTFFVVLSSGWDVLFLWLLVINLISFAAFGIDKRKAKKKEFRPDVRRIPEKTLFLLAGLGGSIGALLGMQVWRHKTQHRTFRFGIPAILAVQLLLFLVFYF